MLLHEVVVGQQVSERTIGGMMVLALCPDRPFCVRVTAYRQARPQKVGLCKRVQSPSATQRDILAILKVH